MKEQIELEQYMQAYSVVDEYYEDLKDRIEEFNLSKCWLECALDVKFKAQTGRIVDVFNEFFEEPLMDIVNVVYNDSYCHCGPTLDKWIGGD